MAEPKKRVLDIFDVLKTIDLKNYHFYDQLPEEHQKAYVPLVIMRWLSGTNDARQIFYLNELVNPGVFRVTNHKGLLHRLMCISSSGKSKRYQWTKANQKKGGSTPTIIRTISEYYKYNSKEAYDVMSLLNDDDILHLAAELGYQKEEIAKINKELKIR